MQDHPRQAPEGAEDVCYLAASILRKIALYIAYIIDHLRSDGTQRVLSQIVAGLAKRGHMQTIICLNDSCDDSLLQTLHSSPAEVQIIGNLKLIVGVGTWPIISILRRKSYDAVVTFLLYSDIYGRAAAHLCHVPHIVSSIRARNVHYNGLQRFLVRFTMRWADSVVLNSRQIYEYAIQEERASPEKVTVIPNGINMEPYLLPSDRSGIFQELGITQDASLIGSVGRLDRQKGYDILFAALAKLERPDWHLVLIGAGSEERALKEQMISLGLSKQVHFTGYRRDVPRLLRALDLYVQPSRYEGMPNALMEAMAAGCPVIASDVDGNCELIKNGVHGWLVPVEDITTLAQTIRFVILNQDIAKQCGQLGKVRIQNEYNQQTMVDSWEEVLTNVVDRKKNQYS